MNASAMDHATKMAALQALRPLLREDMPRSIRLDAAMLRLLLMVATDDRKMASRTVAELKSDLALVRQQALMVKSYGAIYATDEQAVMLYLQAATGQDLAVDSTSWQRPREQDRRELITEIGRSLFFQLGRRA